MISRLLLKKLLGGYNEKQKICIWDIAATFCADAICMDDQ
jgi:hypothetical protein